MSHVCVYKLVPWPPLSTTALFLIIFSCLQCICLMTLVFIIDNIACGQQTVNCWLLLVDYFVVLLNFYSSISFVTYPSTLYPYLHIYHPLTNHSYPLINPSINHHLHTIFLLHWFIHSSLPIIHPPIHLSTHPPIHPSFHHLSTLHPPIHPSTDTYIHLFILPPIYSYIHLFSSILVFPTRLCLIWLYQGFKSLYPTSKH